MRRFWNRRWPWGLALLAVAVLGLAGCAGGAPAATSWTGLTVVEDTIYAADIERAVALDAEVGEPLWSFPRDPKEDNRGLFYATPTVAGDVIIVASELPARGFFSAPRHVVWGLDPQGRDLWSFDDAGGQYVEGGAAADGVFVIGNSDGNVYALDVNTGNLKWKFKTGHRVWATPLIVGDTVYIGSMDRHFYALRLADGSVIWDFRGGGAFASRPALGADGTLYVGAFDDKVYALDAATGSLRWTFPGANWFWGAVALLDDTVYAADVNGNVYAIDAASGAERWRRALLDDKQRPAAVRAGPVPSSDGALIYVGSRSGTLYALDARDGREVWAVTSDGQVYSEPVVVGRVVYYSMIYGSERIRALAADNGRKIWAYAPASGK